jgi:DNA polymerase-4
METWPRVVVHADMDAFYAAVEQRDDPALRGKPLLIGPNSDRGVVLTASYEARPFDVGSAMPMAVARRRCPQAIIVPPRFDRYMAVSREVMDIFASFSPAVEPLSLDEAFLDMTGAGHLFGTPELIGQRIREAVLEATGLAVSVGISGTKYVAKVASAHGKPNGLIVVPPSRAREWLAPLPVDRLWGVGPKTAAKLHALGFRSVGDIARTAEFELCLRLGSAGAHFHRLANAADPRRVSRGRVGKSIGSERTLSRDISQRDDIEMHLRRSAERVARRVRAKNYLAGGVRIRLKTDRFELLTRQARLQHPADTADTFYAVARRLLNALHHPGPFRLVGMAVFDLDWRTREPQGELFTNERPRRLETTIDRLIARFGNGVLIRASDMGEKQTVSDGELNLDYLDYRDGERLSSPG